MTTNTPFTATVHDEPDDGIETFPCDGSAYLVPHKVGWADESFEDGVTRWVPFVELQDSFFASIQPLRLCEDCQNLALAIGHALEGARNG